MFAGGAQAVAVDGSGDVIAAGSIDSSGGDDFMVIKFSAATGAELWRQQIDGTGDPYFESEAARAVAVDASGDVIAAGYLSKFYTGYNFTAIKFSGATGAELWRQQIDGTTRDNDDRA
jgi:outer membrane protein assembly factor BamB